MKGHQPKSDAGRLASAAILFAALVLFLRFA